MSHSRPIHPGTTYFVTRRTERRHCLLRPDSRMTQFILFAFIVSARRHEILVHAFCAMSTHVHYVVTDPNGKLPRFLEMFHRLVALGVKIMRKWEGVVWNGSQTSVVELHTEQAIVEKIAYTLANPVAAGLVHSAEEWPGAKTLGLSVLKARRPSIYFNPKNPKWDIDVEIDITLPPLVPDDCGEAFQNDIIQELDRLESAAHRQIPSKRVLGAKRAQSIPPETRITSKEPRFQRNPTYAVGRGNHGKRDTIDNRLRDFRSAYRKALAEWRAGNRSIEFPAGTYAMRVLHGAKVKLSRTARE